MTPREAVKILMLSPCYWLMDLHARKKLILDFCATYNAVAIDRQQKEISKVKNTG